MSMKFKKATLAAAVVAAMGASSAQAVNFAEDGLGEVAIAPYYTVRGGNDTYINVTNTSEETLIFKIRFRESFNSRDARDFNVVLSPYDVWTAAVTRNASDTGARLVTNDRSCTVPASIRDNGIDFTNLLFTDGGPASLDRTKEGYFEIINMGQDTELTGTDNDSVIAINAKHVNGEPVNCAAVEAEFSTAAKIAATKAAFDEPENVLKVNTSIINVSDGTGFASDAVMLANFFNPAGIDASSPTDNVWAPSDTNPSLADVTPKITDLHSNTVGTALSLDWTVTGVEPADAVSALFQRSAVINQYRVEDGAADTDWVVTFPTKNFYVDQLDFADRPFPQVFTGRVPTTDSGACFKVAYNFWDREEQEVVDQTTVQPSPPQPGSAPDELCREVNVIAFGTGVLGASGAATPITPYAAGWMRLDVGLDGGVINDMVDDTAHTLTGLPVMGTAFTNLDNAVLGNENVQYGFAWNHSYERMISGNID